MSRPEFFKNAIKGLDCEIPNISIAMSAQGKFVIALHVTAEKNSEAVLVLTPENAVEVMETLSLINEKLENLENLKPFKKPKKGDNSSWN